MGSISAQLEEIQNQPAAQRSDGFNRLLDDIVKSATNLDANLVAYVQSITSDNVGVISSRPLLSTFVTRFRDVADNDAKIKAG